MLGGVASSAAGLVLLVAYAVGAWPARRDPETLLGTRWGLGAAGAFAAATLVGGLALQARRRWSIQVVQVAGFVGLFATTTAILGLAGAAAARGSSLGTGWTIVALVAGVADGLVLVRMLLASARPRARGRARRP